MSRDKCWVEVPYTTGGDYTGGVVTASNRRAWEENVGEEGMLWRERRYAYNTRGIDVRTVAEKFAALGTLNQDRIARFVGISKRLQDAMREAGEIVRGLQDYPLIHDDTWELEQEWAQNAWESWGEHQHSKDVRDWVCQRFNIGSPQPYGIVDVPDGVEELCITLHDWEHISGQYEGNGSWFCDNGEDSMHLGKLVQRYAVKWLEESEEIQLWCAQMFGAYAPYLEPDSVQDALVGVAQGTWKPSDALFAVMQPV